MTYTHTQFSIYALFRMRMHIQNIRKLTVTESYVTRNLFFDTTVNGSYLSDTTREMISALKNELYK